MRKLTCLMIALIVLATGTARAQDVRYDFD